MTRDELDRKLLAYLEKSERAEDPVRAALGTLTSQVTLLGQKLDANHVIVSERIAGLSARVDKLEDDVEDTGVHNLSIAREEAQWWKRWLLGVLAAVIAGGVLGAVGYIVGSAKQAPSVNVGGK